MTNFQDDIAGTRQPDAQNVLGGDAASDPVTLGFCKRLPKVELHAHLNGSVSVDTLRLLVGERRSADPSFMENFDLEEQIAKLGGLGDFFQLFGVVYRITDNAAALSRVVQIVLDEFLADGVRYIELRTGPREVLETGMTREVYLEAVLGAMEAHHAAHPELTSRLIVSIDRKIRGEKAMGVVELAARLAPRGVVAVDLCGDPYAATYDEFRPALARARELGLRVVIHMAEIPDSDPESMLMLQDGIVRIGHGTFMGTEVQQVVMRDRIPIEICLTSNIKCSTVPNIECHHFADWHAKRHPLVLCTDDKGVFGAELSEEYMLAAQSFGLNRAQLYELSLTSIDAVLADDAVKEALRQAWSDAKQALCI